MTHALTLRIVVLIVLVSGLAPAGVLRGQSPLTPPPLAPPPPTVLWADTGFRGTMGSIGLTVAHVTEVLLRDGGTQVWAAFYDADGRAHLSRSLDGGATWATSPIPGLTQVRTVVEFDDGSVLFGGAPMRGRAPLIRLLPIPSGASTLRWEACGTGSGSVTLPTTDATDVWDLTRDARGGVYIAGGSGAPVSTPTLVFHSADRCRTITEAAALPGDAAGVTAQALDHYGRLYVATAATAAHDDPATAGKAHVFYSDDRGASWHHTGEMDGANRVYRITVKADGTLLLGTGLSGHFFRSSDRGASWTRTPHVPDGLTLFSGGAYPEVRAMPATRVYSILELEGGWILVGTGNDLGDLFISPDNGTSWFPTGDTGLNLVNWTSAVGADGTIWIGTGSAGGTVLKGRLILR